MPRRCRHRRRRRRERATSPASWRLRLPAASYSLRPDCEESGANGRRVFEKCSCDTPYDNVAMETLSTEVNGSLLSFYSSYSFHSFFFFFFFLRRRRREGHGSQNRRYEGLFVVGIFIHLVILSYSYGTIFLCVQSVSTRLWGTKFLCV